MTKQEKDLIRLDMLSSLDDYLDEKDSVTHRSQSSKKSKASKRRHDQSTDTNSTMSLKKRFVKHKRNSSINQLEVAQKIDYSCKPKAVSPEHRDKNIPFEPLSLLIGDLERDLYGSESEDDSTSGYGSVDKPVRFTADKIKPEHKAILPVILSGGSSQASP